MANFTLRQSDPLKKLILDNEALRAKVFALRMLDASIVVTIGSWDLLHIGHVRYLNRAKTQGDILVVGVDSDRAIKLYKGPDRPIIPQNERCELLCYQECVDFATLVDDVDENGSWLYGLIKLLKPDVFVAVEDSYPEEQRRVIERHSGNLIVLPRQAENTSSTNIIQKRIKTDDSLMKKLHEEGNDDH